MKKALVLFIMLVMAVLLAFDLVWRIDQHRARGAQAPASAVESDVGDLDEEADDYEERGQ